MFADIEAFVTAHRGCGELTADVGELAAAGYTVRLVCTCGAELVRFYHGGRRGAGPVAVESRRLPKLAAGQ